jgi:hypothetical protein
MGVTGVSQPRRTSRTLTLPSPAASHRLAAPAQGEEPAKGEEPANQATATATEASAARAHRNAGLRAERREGVNVLAWAASRSTLRSSWPRKLEPGEE